MSTTESLSRTLGRAVGMTLVTALCTAWYDAAWVAEHELQEYGIFALGSHVPSFETAKNGLPISLLAGIFTTHYFSSRIIGSSR